MVALQSVDAKAGFDIPDLDGVVEGPGHKTITWIIDRNNTFIQNKK